VPSNAWRERSRSPQLFERPLTAMAIGVFLLTMFGRLAHRGFRRLRIANAAGPVLVVLIALCLIAD